MKILSLNAWAGRLYPALIDYLQHADADVMCLQEVLRSQDGQPTWLAYRDEGVELRQRANLFDDLRRTFPGHEAYFCPSMRGQLLDEDVPVLVEFGLATLVRRTYSVIGHAMDFVHGEFSAGGWGSHPRPRNAHVLRLMDFETSTVTTVAHIHGLRETDGKHDTTERLGQSQAFVELIGRLRRSGERLVACGDFNLLPTSAAFNALGAIGLVDLVTSRGFVDTRTSHYQKPERYADYLLVTPNVEVVDFEVVTEPEVSDHRALVLTAR